MKSSVPREIKNAATTISKSGVVNNGVDSIRKAIENRIINGEIAPGERINELEMARKLKVNRRNIREALRLLEQAGLVVVVHNQGVFVHKLALEEVLDLYDVRAGLFHVVGRLVTSRITKEELDDLKRIFADMEAARIAFEAVSYEQAHDLFHERILTITRNPALIGFHRQIDMQLRLFMRRSVVSLARLRSSNKAHGRIIKEIEKGDCERVSSALVDDAMHGRERLLDSLTRNKP